MIEIACAAAGSCPAPLESPADPLDALDASGLPDTAASGFPPAAAVVVVVPPVPDDARPPLPPAFEPLGAVVPLFPALVFDGESPAGGEF